MDATQKNVEDLQASLRILRNNLEMYKKGEIDSYRTISGELRKLLLDGKVPLVLRVYVDFRPHKLNSSEIFGRNLDLLNGLVHYVPGRIVKSEGGVTLFDLLFARTQESMPLDEWLKQMVFKEGISIKQLIKTVADKEGVHADPNFDTTLEYTRSWNWNNVYCHVLAIYGIGKYIYEFTQKEKLKINN